jgi:hypothetical protein
MMFLSDIMFALAAVMHGFFLVLDIQARAPARRRGASAEARAR